MCYEFDVSSVLVKISMLAEFGRYFIFILSDRLHDSV